MSEMILNFFVELEQESTPRAGAAAHSIGEWIITLTPIELRDAVERALNEMDMLTAGAIWMKPPAPSDHFSDMSDAGELPDAAGVYARRRGKVGDVYVEIGATIPVRLRAAIEEAAAHVDDRRLLIVACYPDCANVLRAEEDWKDVPACFGGDAQIVGSFYGVPVRVGTEYPPDDVVVLLPARPAMSGVAFGTGARVLGGFTVLASGMVASVRERAGDITPAESEHEGEQRAERMREDRGYFKS